MLNSLYPSFYLTPVCRTSPELCKERFKKRHPAVEDPDTSLQWEVPALLDSTERT